ncbi:unnamed protein product [Sphagnum jensenii]|uniref:LysM domain-containing protein n=1 Tax=Sphagnum jensenii TaxID=128206 RepID=A0ABP1AW37_9BRYO
MELAMAAVSLPTTTAALTDSFFASSCWRQLETTGVFGQQGSRLSSNHLLRLACSAHHHHHHHSRDCEERWNSIRLLSCGRRAVLSDVSKSGSPTYGRDHKSISRREAVAARSEAIDAVYEEDAPFSSSQYKLHPVQEGDTLTAIAKQYDATVERIAVLNNISDADLLQTGQELVIPVLSRELTHNKETTSSENLINCTAPSRLEQGTFASASSRNKSTLSMGPATSGYRTFAVPTLVKLALPLMLMAPILGFGVRCLADYIHIHINKEVAQRYAELEAYHARHRPSVKRWQSILDGDRDDKQELVGATAFVTADEVRPVTDWWSQGGRFRSSAIEENQTEEEQDVRQQQDFEEIRKSYAELESTYTKFLSDSGLSSVEYCRVGVHLLQEDI